ncbi:MAG: VWA domain-containing protein [Bryobacteraceae bacterium]
MPATMFFITTFFILLLAIPALSQTPNQPETRKPPAPQEQPAQPDETIAPTFRSDVSNVRVDVQVVEDNKLITGLTQADFIVYDEGKPQEIVYFGHDAEPLSVLLLLDVSGSMRKYVEQVANVSRDALRQLHLSDRVALMVFTKETKLQEDFTKVKADIVAEIKDASWGDSLGSGTSINDSLLDAAEYMDKNSGETGRRAILMLTDNLGLNYKSPDEPVIKALQSADTVLNAMVVGRARRPEPARNGKYTNPDFTSPNVFRIAEETGGEAVKAGRGTGEAFRQMIDRIRTRYSLHYRAPEGGGSGFHNVRVDLSPAARQRYPNAELRHRRGYYAGS